jgi:hypothetical protein
MAKLDGWSACANLSSVKRTYLLPKCKMPALKHAKLKPQNFYDSETKSSIQDLYSLLRLSKNPKSMTLRFIISDFTTCEIRKNARIGLFRQSRYDSVNIRAKKMLDIIF